ncbi:MAG: hypothetical protein M3022_04500 [Actinomycetota bacterium]|nr:hypothetical protein [Actinomycetota bacterium]
MADPGTGMVAFLGVLADRRLLDEDLGSLPELEQRHWPVAITHEHDRLVAAGSLLTGATLIAGVAMLLYGAGTALLAGGGVFDVVLAVIGILLVSTHWGWVHVAEYLGITIDQRRRRDAEADERGWLATIHPYPRFSVSTTVLSDASTRVQRFRHEPVLVTPHTFSFVRHAETEQSYDADAPAEAVAAGVETMRRQARLDTDRLRGDWEAASSAYEAALFSAEDDQQRLAAQRAAATALSEHINASLLEPPQVE